MSLFNNLFKKNQSQVSKQEYYSVQKVQLPMDFAQRVMELEMQTEFEESCEMEAVQELNQLYRMAVEYYSTVDVKKANHFQKKLTELLTNPNTIQVIQEKEKAKGKADSPGSNSDSRPYEKYLNQELHKFNSQSSVVVKSMIEGNEKKIQHHSRLIHQNLASQQNRLQRRLEERSKSKSKKRM